MFQHMHSDRIAVCPSHAQPTVARNEARARAASAAVPGMEPTLSLIVIVYNVAPYLERCLASLESQDLSGIEVIFVDDGSTDRSLGILAEHVARYPSHMRVVRRHNGGVSVARNTGLEQSRGEYVAFVDSDDWFEAGYYRNLLDLARRHDLDIAHGNAAYRFDDGLREGYPIYCDDLPAGVMAGRDMLRYRLRRKTLLHMVWMHVYRRSFIEAEGMRFVPELIHQDVLWTTQAFLAARRVAYDPTPGYYYRRDHWRANANPYDRRPEKVIPSSVYNAHGLARMADGLGDDRELQQLIRWQLVDGGLSIFHHLCKIPDPATRRKLYRKLRSGGTIRLLWVNSQNLTQRRRIARNWLKSWFFHGESYGLLSGDTP